MNSEVRALDTQEITTYYKVKRVIYLGTKRLFDLLFSLIGLVFMLPIAIVVKLAYVLTGDFSSIFYIQQRIGKNGKKIGIYKFRSMVPNADEKLIGLLEKEPFKTEWKKNHKLENDPRITKIGKVLRSTSLDELPQFINVFINDMSVIGPRPLVEGELDEHNGNHEIYESVKPGITGWWACNGRSATTYEKRLQLEYYYVEHCSLLLDIKCIFKTISAIIKKTGAK